ncbi:MAG: hypothetical protein AAGJ29_13995 [Pseudomonadota bacterium]
MVEQQTEQPLSPAAQEAARLAAQKRRNVWLGLALAGFVVLVALVSAVRLAENIANQAGAG